MLINKFIYYGICDDVFISRFILYMLPIIVPIDQLQLLLVIIYKYY